MHRIYISSQCVRKVCACELVRGINPLSLYAFLKSVYTPVSCVEQELRSCYRSLAAANKPSTITHISIKTSCFRNCSTQRRARWHYHLVLNKLRCLLLLQMTGRSQMQNFTGTMILLITHYKLKLCGRMVQSDILLHFTS
jgi:hypothetical protein